jgi:hypothetical protein
MEDQILEAEAHGHFRLGSLLNLVIVSSGNIVECSTDLSGDPDAAHASFNAVDMSSGRNYNVKVNLGSPDYDDDGFIKITSMYFSGTYQLVSSQASLTCRISGGGGPGK